MATYELTGAQVKNLLGFLNRVQLRGNEVGSFLEIVNALAPKPIVKKEKKKLKN